MEGEPRGSCPEASVRYHAGTPPVCTRVPAQGCGSPAHRAAGAGPGLGQSLGTHEGSPPPPARRCSPAVPRSSPRAWRVPGNPAQSCLLWGDTEGVTAKRLRCCEAPRDEPRAPHPGQQCHLLFGETRSIRASPAAADPSPALCTLTARPGLYARPRAKH